MQYGEIVALIADILKAFDSERPIHKAFKPGIGPFGEPQIVANIARRLSARGVPAETRRAPDLDIQHEWALEFKIVRPYGDNGREAENWSANLLHPYEGNVSLIGDAIKLGRLNSYRYKGLLMIGYQHNPPKIKLDPLISSFELIARDIMGIRLAERVEERRDQLVHPEHQVLRCVGWELEEGQVTPQGNRRTASP
ncbi:MAG: hypothetical protein HY688_00640 [Chloroflexi bacterium]|nr:hypothetical protein [Chloroflexota bacterium]